MHNLSGRAAAQLNVFSGTVTIAEPHDLPEGASPRNQNVDFGIGSVKTRGSLINPFVYSNSSIGPIAGGSAVDTNIGGQAWSNPTRVLTDSGTYATAFVAGNGTLTPTITGISQSGGSIPWIQLPDMISNGSTGVAYINTVPGFPSGQQETAKITIQGTLPVNSTIIGIAVNCVSWCGYPSFTPALSMSFESGVGAGTRTFNVTTSSSAITLGGPTDTWGTPPTAAQLAAGVILDVNAISGGGVNYLYIYGVSVTIYYSQGTTDAIDVKTFGISIPATDSPQGFSLSIKGYSTASAMLNVQMLKNGLPVGNLRSIAFPIGSVGTVNLGGINDLFGTSWIYSDLNNVNFGIRITATSSVATSFFVGYATLTAYFTPTAENFNYITTFQDSFGNIRTLALDASGQWWIENVNSSFGNLIPLFAGPSAGSFANSFTAESRQYIAYSDLSQGNYIPQQYTGQWVDQISQVGPGAAPTFTTISTGSLTYAISTITQPAQHSYGFSYFLQSSGPGSQSAGNTVTIYYADSTVTTADADLVNAFNSGHPVYVYASFTGGPATQGPYTVQVTSVGEGQPPGQPRQFFYFTYNVPTSQFIYYKGSGHPGYTITYQRSLATMTTSVPVPGLEIGGIAAVTGSSISNYNSNWTITQTPNAGSVTITQTVVSSGIATFSYTLINGAVPAAGQIITITGTNNANGQLNFAQATIDTASGGTTGTFTIDVSLPDFAVETESGLGNTAGTIFNFDPGALVVGSSTNPIYGNATGGTITFNATGQFMTAGTRKGTVFFIDRNGTWTRPAPPSKFSGAGSITGIQAANIPIGPPNIIARAIAFTEAGQNGVPGANFFTLPTQQQYIVNDITYTASALFINDNVTTNATFFFSDSVLLNGTAIDVEGFDLFNLGELGESAWCFPYANRAVFGRVRNKIHNFLNLSFDGGYLSNPGANLLPLGWNPVSSTFPSGSTVTLNVSPVFGNSIYIANTTSITQSQLGMFYQSAFQDWNNVAILQNQTAYSVRISARIPSSVPTGNLVVDLTTFDSGTGFGTTYGSFVLPFASMSSTMATYQGTLLTNTSLNIPANLVLRIWAQNIIFGADLEIDRISIFPTQQPTNLTGLSISYKNDFSSFDLVTGGTDTTTTNSQPANGAFEIDQRLYIVKESSLGFISDTPNQEPANWNPYEEVSPVVGAAGINAYDTGERWAVMGCRNGLYLFNGGNPVPIHTEIQDIWNAINWNAGQTICIRNDIFNKRIYCAIPLPTPNPWMLDADVNPTPITPNVVLMLNYVGIGSIEQLMEGSPMHMTMTGKLAVHDFRRKWSLWTIPTPYIGMIKRSNLQKLMMFCNGIGSSKIYYIGNTPTGFDDGTAFTSSYCTYAFVDEELAKGNPMFGEWNKRYNYWDILATGLGTASLTFYQNQLTAPYPFVVPGDITLQDETASTNANKLIANNDLEGPLDEFGQRMFVEIAITGGYFDLSRVTLAGAADAYNSIRGV